MTCTLIIINSSYTHVCHNFMDNMNTTASCSTLYILIQCSMQNLKSIIDNRYASYCIITFFTSIHDRTTPYKIHMSITHLS